MGQALRKLAFHGRQKTRVIPGFLCEPNLSVALSIDWQRVGFAGTRFRERRTAKKRGEENGTENASIGSVALGLTKPTELLAPKTSLTPCILDDDPGQLEMLTSVVASMGYEAVPTTDPEEALKLIKRGRCRLALVDVHMPAMDGYEFLNQALQSDPGVNILLMTGDYTLDSALEAIRRGAADFLPKPIDRAHLKKTLDDAAKLYDQRRRVRVLEEQLLKDLEFHGIVGKVRRCWKSSILRAKWRGITRTCCWRGLRDRARNWWRERFTS
jgi:CheY-like chemotaxis protein